MRKIEIKAGVIFILSFSFLFFSRQAFAQVPFGGQVMVEYTCNDGLLLYVREPMGFTTLLWHYGELPYNYHVVPHIGQNMLGWYQVAPETCMLGPYTIGVGFPILFHGDSL